VKSFREHALFPSEGGALPHLAGHRLADHWAFWQGYPALMVTDTAPSGRRIITPRKTHRIN
jgi:hypothetical protein